MNKATLERERWALTMKVRQWVLLFAAGTLVDVILTFVMLDRYNATELNPIAGEINGYISIVVLKLVMMLIFVAASSALALSEHAGRAWAGMQALRAGVAIIWLVVIWNTINLIAEILA